LDTIALGKHNPRLIEIRKALENGELTPDGLLAVEGPKLIREAHESGLEIAAVFARRDTPVLAFADVADVYTLDEAAFKKLQSTETSQGLIGLVRIHTYQMENITDNPKGPIVVLGRLQDPGNVGAIFRVSESFGAAGCVGLADTASPYNPKTVRASAGSVLRVPHVWNATIDHVTSVLRNAKIPIVGTSPHAAKTIAEWDWSAPVAVWIGQEGGGMEPEEAQVCDAMLRIPHRTTVESLNSATAAAIILYEAFRRRGLDERFSL
jgi:RNA methyltransferase, TrmH family